MNKLSIEQIENDFWEPLHQYPSGLVERCHKYRKIPIQSLSIEQLRTLLSQNIGVNHILELVMETLEKDPLAEGDNYKGDLLNSTSRINTDFWRNMPELAIKFKRIVESNKVAISKEMSDEDLERLLDACQNI